MPKLYLGVRTFCESSVFSLERAVRENLSPGVPGLARFFSSLFLLLSLLARLLQRNAQRLSRQTSSRKLEKLHNLTPNFSMNQHFSYFKSLGGYLGVGNEGREQAAKVLKFLVF